VRPVLVGAVAAVVAGEVACRVGLGLGDPPLFVADQEIEYLPRPGVYRRFGHRVSYNAFHMRSAEVGERAQEGERRVLVLGDSVPNGGAKLDDAELATALLEGRLGRRVLNVSCGSWGPANLLAYVRRFGWFDAGVAVVVLNDADAWDVPTFGPLGGELPTRKPVSALWEAATRYLPRVLGRGGTPAVELSPEDVEASLSALRELVGLLRSEGVGVAFVLHAERAEVRGSAARGTVLLRRTAQELEVPVVETGPAMAGAGLDRVYDGRVHLTAEGQRVLADVLAEAVERAGGR